MTLSSSFFSSAVLSSTSPVEMAWWADGDSISRSCLFSGGVDDDGDSVAASTVTRASV